MNRRLGLVGLLVGCATGGGAFTNIDAYPRLFIRNGWTDTVQVTVETANNPSRLVAVVAPGDSTCAQLPYYDVAVQVRVTTKEGTVVRPLTLDGPRLWILEIADTTAAHPDSLAQVWCQQQL